MATAVNGGCPSLLCQCRQRGNGVSRLKDQLQPLLGEAGAVLSPGAVLAPGVGGSSSSSTCWLRSCSRSTARIGVPLGASVSWPSGASSSTAELAVAQACLRLGGVCAKDEDAGDVMRCIEFPRIKGGKPFNVEIDWYKKMMVEIGQTEADAYPVAK